MATYDDKTQGIVKSGNYFFINSIKSRTEAIFKASYIVGSNLQIEGKITALFDLIVVGNIYAHDIEVKGNLICLGNCTVINSITVQGKLFAKSVRAKTIEVHDEITAQEVDVNFLNVDGNIMVGKTLAVENSVDCGQKIMCGETAYGAGTLSAYEIITGEELDMDDGFKSVLEPCRIQTVEVKGHEIGMLGKKFAIRNDYNSFLTELKKVNNVSLDGSINRWKRTLDEVSDIVKQHKFACYDIGILLSLVEISNSIYFSGWEKIEQWQQYIFDKFNKIANGEELEEPTPLTLDSLAVDQRVRSKIYGLGTIKKLSKIPHIKATVAFDTGKEADFQMDIAIKHFSSVEDDILSPEKRLEMLFIKPKEYGEWLAYLNVLRTYGNKFNKNLYNISIDLLYSIIGIKSKFIMERLKENGWKDNV